MIRVLSIRAARACGSSTTATCRWQPFAGLIIAGLRDVENRTWSPPKAVLGERIAIHASGAAPSGEARRYLEEVMRDGWRRFERLPVALRQRGALLGTVELVAAPHETRCMRHSPWCETIGGDGAYHWLLASPRALRRPISCHGRLSLWTTEAL